MPKRLPTAIDGVALLEPQVHGDERGFLVETFRRDTWAEQGVGVDFVQHNQSRSLRHTLRGLHFQTEPGQAKLVRCPRGGRSSMSRLIFAAVLPASDAGRATSLTIRAIASSSYRSVSATVSWCSARSPTSPTCSPVTYDPLTEAGIAWDDPEMAVQWPLEAGAQALLSERDKRSAAL